MCVLRRYGMSLLLNDIQGRIELTDSSKAEDLRLDFEGLHFVSNGSIYGLADPSG